MPLLPTGPVVPVIPYNPCVPGGPGKPSDPSGPAGPVGPVLPFKDETFRADSSRRKRHNFYYSKINCASSTLDNNGFEVY
jgi:hypothetical protein